MIPTTTTIELVEQALVAFEDAMTPEQPSDTARLARARLALAKAVNSFVADETQQLTAMERLGIATAPLLEQKAIYQDLLTLRARYSAHIAQWTSARVDSDWRRYRSDSVGLVVAMRKILRARARLRLAASS